MMKCTQDDIAKKLGISRVAVSYALSGSREVSEKTRKKVLRIAAQMGYRMNKAAQSTKTGRFNNLALIMSEMGFYSHLPKDMLLGLEKGASKFNKHLIISRLPDSQLTNPDYMPKILSEQSSDGVIINYQYNFPLHMKKLIEKYKIPSVWLNVKQDYDSVYPDEFNAGRKATEFLLNKGFLRIIYIDFSHGEKELPYKHFSAKDRAEGYKEAMNKARLKPCIIRHPDSSFPSHLRLDEAIKILTQQPAPQAFVTYSDTSAIPLIFAGALTKIPVGTPEIPVVLFADHEFNFLNFTLPTMRTPNAEIAEAAVEMLINKINAPKLKLKSRIITYSNCL